MTDRSDAELTRLSDDLTGLLPGGADVAKVYPGFDSIAATDFHRGPILAGHEAPSPGNQGDNNLMSPRTGSGVETAERAVGAYNQNQQRAQAEHVSSSQGCESRPVVTSLSPPAGLRTDNVSQRYDLPNLTGCAPGEER